ncbi:LCP family protein [Sellimonas catena]|uniref:LytR family transcriptional regulator n=1 Tax=Sellimonas catena TaxID=2994035 RepID=A0A9W6C469_9FIRM|nr:LCP family protein [Sellimonas catena]GLG03393.1 LytR family transcriptional regulator [Sellimonas catena]
MVQKESGNGKLPENRPVRRQKRRADASGQKKSDSDYNMDEGQERTTTRKRKTEGTRRKIPDRLTEEEKRARRLKEIGRRKERKAERAGAARGMVFFAFQLASSLAFLWLLCWMDILLMEYLLGIAGVLLVLLGITLISQLAVRGRGKIVGKVFSFLMTIVLAVGSFYIYKTGGALLSIAGGGSESHKMVAVVRESDKAEELSDAEDYVFGIQYATDGENTDKALSNINKQLKKSIDTEVFDNMEEMAQALMDEEIDIIVYDSNYQNTMEKASEGFGSNTRVIYEYTVEETQDVSLDVPVQSEPFTVYISGIDIYGNVEDSSRSDVNIIATVNPTTHQILLVTTPRDYYVEIPGISGGMKDKLTHAGNYGVDVSIDTLEELYQVSIPFYGRLNFTSFINIIDILGGVDVESEYAFTTGTDAGAVVEIQEGTNHLDGQEALAFARERHALVDGDNQRGKNQEALITAMIKKMVSPSMIVKAADILDEAADSVETNMSMKQIRALIKQQLSDHSDWQIYSMAADGIGGQEMCYSTGSQYLYVTIPNEDTVAEIADMINKVEAGEMIEGSETADGT